jgi:hypothetical protein
MEQLKASMGLTMFAPSRPKPWLETSALLTEVLDRTYKEVKDAEPPRTYLGASMMGRECVREVAYQYHQAAKDVERGFSGRIYRVFDMGHDGEARMAQYLCVGGFDLREKGKDGKQFGYCVADGKMQGHIDGVILSGPDVGCEWPALWENKALNDKGFKDVTAKGIEKSKPVYFAQVQIYMAYLQLERCFFTCINRDTGEVSAEVIPFDAAKAQAISDRGVRVIGSINPEEFPRISRDSTDFRCKFCDYHGSCWGKAEIAAPEAARPGWLTGA